jgi:GT2 family glycosyltransferase
MTMAPDGSAGRDRVTGPARVHVVLAVHDRKEQTLACLQDLGAQTYPDLVVIVVDDGSRDGTDEAIRSRFPATVVLKGDGNLWWSGATNRGVAHALAHGGAGDFVLTLNNDTRVGPAYVQSLVEAAGAHPGSLVGSVAVSDDAHDMIRDGGCSLSWWTAKLRVHGRGQPLGESRKRGGRFVATDLLTGRGTLVPMAVYRTVGLYDEAHLPQYGADFELALRARRAGFRLLVDYDAVVIAATRLTGPNNDSGRLPWRELGRSFFTKKSVYDLRTRYQFARLCAPRPLFASYLVLDTCRLLAGRIRNQFRRNRRPAG